MFVDEKNNENIFSLTQRKEKYYIETLTSETWHFRFGEKKKRIVQEKVILFLGCSWFFSSWEFFLHPFCQFSLEYCTIYDFFFFAKKLPTILAILNFISVLPKGVFGEKTFNTNSRTFQRIMIKQVWVAQLNPSIYYNNFVIRCCKI